MGKLCQCLYRWSAPSMLGCKKEFVAYVLKVNPNVKIVHCMIHRKALVTKALPEKLSQTSHLGRQLYEIKVTPNKNFFYHYMRLSK
jgi:hypothetical protein